METPQDDLLSLRQFEQLLQDQFQQVQVVSAKDRTVMLSYKQKLWLSSTYYPFKKHHYDTQDTKTWMGRSLKMWMPLRTHQFHAKFVDVHSSSLLISQCFALSLPKLAHLYIVNIHTVANETIVLCYHFSHDVHFNTCKENKQGKNGSYVS